MEMAIKKIKTEMGRGRLRMERVNDMQFVGFVFNIMAGDINVWCWILLI